MCAESASGSSPGPLEGYRVVDMTQVVMGPFASQVLADFGADVIKVEPLAGDTSRLIPPAKHKGMGPVHLHINRNKRSLVLDLKQPQGIDAFMRLIATADVLISNVRPKAMDRLGITYESLVAANPRLIYLSLVGFGLDGPYDARPVYEDILQSLTAVPTMLTRTGAPAPMFVPVTYNDRACGLSAANIILAALLARGRTGRGQHVVMPMFETMAQFVLGDHMGGRTYDPPIGPMGYMRVLSELRRPFATEDGFICLVLYTDLHWRAFLSLVGKEDWLVNDPRLQSITQRAEHAHDIYKPIAEMLRLKTSSEWLALLEAADIPCAPVHTLDTLLEDEHLKATGFLHSTEHPSEGRITQMGVPSRWSDTQPTLRRHAPQLGEHSMEILRELGLSEAEIERLMERRISQVPQTTPPPALP